MNICAYSNFAKGLVLTASTFITAHAACAATPTDGAADIVTQVNSASGWQINQGLRATVRAISAESSVRDEDETIAGDAIAVLLTPSLVLGDEDTQIAFRNTTTRIEYRDGARADRWLNAARLSATFRLGENTRFSASGERSDNLLAAEFSSADEWELGGEIEHSLDQANRIQIGASWRERRYDDTEQSTGSGLRVHGEYRYRFAANQYAFLRSRYETIDSANPLRRIDRFVAEASYQHPIASDLRARAEVTYQRLNFPGRTLAAGAVRQDDLFWPELSLIYSPGKWQISGEARYVVRNSTDADFNRSGYRLELEASHAF